MKTLNPYPGKFEGNESQMMAEAAYQASFDGCDEEAGDVSECGLWAGLVHGKRYSFIITEDDQGFVDVCSYRKGDPECQADWDKLAAELDAQESN